MTENGLPVGPRGKCWCHRPDFWCDLHGPSFARGQGSDEAYALVAGINPCKLARVEYNGDQFCYEHIGAAHRGDEVTICDKHPNYERYNGGGK